MKINEIVTFVVPAYNAEKTIARTIESVLHQTDKRYKLIIVNDGSSDATEEICKRYLIDHTDKIRYIFQENRGLGGARNCGMQLVDTPYVSFLDSDDWLMPQYVEKLTKNLEEHNNQNIEVILTLPQIFHEGSKVVKDWYDKSLFEDLFPKDGDVIDPQERTEIYRFEVNQCRKVLQMDFVRKMNFRFREKVKWEDVYPHFYLLSKCSACMGIAETGFYYRVGSSSQITASRGKDRLDLLIVFDDLMHYISGESRGNLHFPVMRVMVRFSIWCIRMADTDNRRILVDKLHGVFKRMPKGYYTALKKGVRGSCSKADALQYLLFITAIRFKLFNFIFYDYLWQDIGEKIIKKLLGAGEKVA